MCIRDSYKVITGDENSADQMAAFCNQFDKVADGLGCAVIYCHHHSKGAQGGKRSMDRASGSGVFARDPDALLDLSLIHIFMGVGEELAALDAQKQAAYNQRLAVGQMERQKRGAANDMRHWPDAPAQEVSASELIAEQSAILARNGENQRKRMEAQQVKARLDAAMGELARMNEQSAELARRMAEKSAEVERLSADAAAAAKTAEQLRDESTAELEEQLRQVEAVNDKVRTNMRRAAAMAEADELKAQYDELDERVRGLQKARTDLLRGAKLPLEGLAVEFDAKGEPRLT